MEAVITVRGLYMSSKPAGYPVFLSLAGREVYRCRGDSLLPHVCSIPGVAPPPHAAPAPRDPGCDKAAASAPLSALLLTV